jgi:hypothetical protein
MLTVLCSIVMNVSKAWGAKKGESPQWSKPEDFLPKYGQEEEDELPQSAEEIKRIFMNLAGSKLRMKKRKR